MFKGAWIKYASFGGVVVFSFGLIGFASWHYAKYRKENEERRNAAAEHDTDRRQKPLELTCDLTNLNSATCVFEQQNSAGADEHTKADLKAQQEAAEWAFLSMLIAGAGLVATVAGLIFVVQTLKINREAVTVADRNSRYQTRAYLHVNGVQLYWGGVTVQKPEFVIEIINTGQTPAKWVEIKQNVFCNKVQISEWLTSLKLDRSTFPDEFSERWNSVGANSNLPIPVTPDISQSISLKRVYGSHDDDETINIAGVIRYATVFGEVFESEFWFRKHGTFKFRQERMSPETKSRLIASFGGKEIPAEMDRVPVKLASYKNVSAD